MMISSPVAAAQAGHASGGGLLSTLTGGLVGGSPASATQVDPGPHGDGSVGLFDGVFKKALISGGIGAAIGFIPFIPGGPVLGGIMGALSGAAMGVFSNWRKQQQIKQENQAMIAALGVQANDPQVQKILQSGDVSQLIPLMQQQGAGVQQGGVGQTGAVQQGAGSATQKSTEPDIQQMTDPATGVTQTINLTTGEVVQAGSGTGTGTAAQVATQNSSALPSVIDPSQGAVQVGSGGGGAGGAINPNVAVNPGVAPALAGGGGSAGDAGRPAAPAGVNSANVAAIAPAQAGVNALGTSSVTTKAQLQQLILKLQAEIDELKKLMAESVLTDDASTTAQAA
jgi:hypothetical protein